MFFGGHVVIKGFPILKVVYLDIAERKWECADRASDYACSGRLQTDCQDESEPFDQVDFVWDNHQINLFRL